MTVNRYAAMWTEDSRYCYRIGCQCDKCNMRKIYNIPCRMKEAVFELVKKFGAPPDKYLFSKFQRGVVEAILSGATTRSNIAKYLNKTETQVQGIMPRLYQIAEENGAIYDNPKNKFEVFVDWVKENITDENNEYIM